MFKQIGYILSFVLIFLLVINTGQALQYSKINSVQDCLDVYDGSFACFSILAEKTNDVSLCDYNVKESVSVERKDRCIRNVAVKNKNVLVCDRFTGEMRGECIFSVAVEMQNAAICDSISDELIYRARLPQMKLKDACHEQIIQFQKHECSDLRDVVSRNFCYIQECESTQCCYNIQGTPQSANQVNTCLSKVSVITKDIPLCIQSKDRKCISKIITSLESPPLSICDQFKNVNLQDQLEVSAYVECVGAVADANKNPKLCLQTFSKQEEITNCLLKANQIGACKLIIDTNKRDECARHVALYVSKTADDCNIISDYSKKQMCRSSAPNRSNWIVCLLIVILIAGTYFTFLKNKEEYLPWTIGLATIFVQRMLLIITSLSLVQKVMSVVPIVGFVSAIRFTDWFLLFSGLRRYLPFNWLYFLVIDIITLLAIVLVGYAAKKTGINVLKTTLIFIGILVAIAVLIILALAALLGGS